jgi:hypothetical protein
MLVTSLLERKVRQEMNKRDLDDIPIYPEGRPCKAPTADKLLDAFSDVRLQHICNGSLVVQTVPDELSKVQRLILDLVGLSTKEYFGSG